MPLSVGEIFLSYNHAETETCVALQAALRAAGFGVFRDADSLRTGDRWLSKLQEALTACTAFVVLVGRDGVRRWVGAEVDVALVRNLSARSDEERLAIFPILLDDVSVESLPSFLALHQCVRWRRGEDAPAELIFALRAHHRPRVAVQTFSGCPYLGLRAFQRGDAALYFGRRIETWKALQRIGDQDDRNPEVLARSGGGRFRWLEIYGGSGAGKTSLVHAGLLPLVEQGALWARTGIERWTVMGSMAPGGDPLAMLAELLQRGLVTEPERRDIKRQLAALRDGTDGLAMTLRAFKDDGRAFLLVIDQFEELFALSDEASRLQFDAVVAHALRDAECPFYLISTVRGDFLDRYDELPRLQALTDSHCNHFLLGAVSETGLRELIEEPARLAGLDASEVTAAILSDAGTEIGALPLVENALRVLWERRDAGRLLGNVYRQMGGLSGILANEADALLDRIEREQTGGRRATLELLLRLTRVGEDGRNTRARMAREDAVWIAGSGERARGERVLRLLTGQRADADVASAAAAGAVRLLSVAEESGTYFVDLIHETLIRRRGRDADGNALGYWQTLYDYIERNRDRDLQVRQLRAAAQRWGQSRGIARWWTLVGIGEQLRLRRVRPRPDGSEARFLAASFKASGIEAIFLVMLAIALGSAVTWAQVWDRLQPSYALVKPLAETLWGLGLTAPMPKLVHIDAGQFWMGCRPERDLLEDMKVCPENELPAREVSVRPFLLGETEVTKLQFAYSIWKRHHDGNFSAIDVSAVMQRTHATAWNWGQADNPATEISLQDAKSYAAWFGRETGQRCRMPREAEWEYAARAGNDQGAFWWGRDVKRGNSTAHANCDGCGSDWDGKSTSPVRSFPPNPFHLYDMAGNVWQWTDDAYGSYADRKTGALAVATQNASDPADPAMRGGSWYFSTTGARASYRTKPDPGNRTDGMGFRLACDQ